MFVLTGNSECSLCCGFVERGQQKRKKKLNERTPAIEITVKLNTTGKKEGWKKADTHKHFCMHTAQHKTAWIVNRNESEKNENPCAPASQWTCHPSPLPHTQTNLVHIHCFRQVPPQNSRKKNSILDSMITNNSAERSAQLYSVFWALYDFCYYEMKNTNLPNIKSLRRMSTKGVLNVFN